jgi:dihydrodipicolinate synthase/N-acetylneuraminate lyase
MKEVLRLQGLIDCAAVREPQLGIDDAERAHIRRLMIDNGLLT